MPFARIDLAKGKTPEYRATVADVVYEGLSGPEGAGWRPLHGHRRACTGEFRVRSELSRHQAIAGPHLHPGNQHRRNTTRSRSLPSSGRWPTKLNRRLSVRREDVFISLVFVDREDWSFGNGEPW